MQSASTERLARILATAGVIPPEQRALAREVDGSESLARRIVRLGLATEDEIAHAVSYLEGSWAFEIDTPGERLDRRMEIEIQGLPADHVTSFVPRLKRLDPAAVNAALARHFRPSELVIVVTTTAEEMLPRLSGLPLGEIQVVDHASY